MQIIGVVCWMLSELKKWNLGKQIKNSIDKACLLKNKNVCAQKVCSKDVMYDKTIRLLNHTPLMSCLGQFSTMCFNLYMF